MQAVNYVAWFNIRDGINHDDPATADLQQVTVASPGSSAKAPNATIEFTPLLTSSAALGPDPGGSGEDAGSGEDPGQLQAGGRAAGDRRAGARGAEIGVHRAAAGLPAGQKRPDNFPAYKAQTDGPANMVVVADSDILADRFWVRMSATSSASRPRRRSADNGPFVANLIGTLAGGDALIGLRSRGDTNRPFTLVERDAERSRGAVPPDRAGAAEAIWTTCRSNCRRCDQGGEGETEQAANAEAVITPEQRAAIDAARKDIVDTRQQLRAVQFELNRNISHLENWLRVFNIVLVPALLTILAIVLGLVRRRRARARA